MILFHPFILQGLHSKVKYQNKRLVSLDDFKEIFGEGNLIEQYEDYEGKT